MGRRKQKTTVSGEGQEQKVVNLCPISSGSQGFSMQGVFCEIQQHRTFHFQVLLTCGNTKEQPHGTEDSGLKGPVKRKGSFDKTWNRKQSFTLQNSKISMVSSQETYFNKTRNFVLALLIFLVFLQEIFRRRPESCAQSSERTFRTLITL